MRAARASLDSDNPPPAPKIEPYKTHLAYVKERRSDAEAEEILDEALSSCAPGGSPARSSSERSRRVFARLLDVESAASVASKSGRRVGAYAHGTCDATAVQIGGGHR